MIQISEITQEGMNWLKEDIKAPFVHTAIYALGGPQNASLCIKVSMDPKESWANGIFHNSSWSIFWFRQNGSVEQQTRGGNFPKFRKTKAEDLAEVAEKINKCLSKSNANPSKIK